MWLIDTTTLKLHERSEGAKYTILSHTWDREEVSHKHMSNLAVASTKKGFAKIAKTCEIAKASGIDWAWVDTCCIDKSSSAELTESINSMWRWYQEAEICYAYLSDFVMPQVVNSQLPEEAASGVDFEDCRWFTRGWTLQELLAPNKVVFLDKYWTVCGTKVSLRKQISEITRISSHVLEDSSRLDRIPIASRMSWAAKRHTTREEDRAYSLFGIFDVNLPLIYGEGSKAFYRLQEAILQDCTDLSIFAWNNEVEKLDDIFGQRYRGLLASSPSDFWDCVDILPVSELGDDPGDIQMTNKGVRLGINGLKLYDERESPLWRVLVPGPDQTQLHDSHSGTQGGRSTHMIDLRHKFSCPHLGDRRVYLQVFRTSYYFARRARRVLPTSYLDPAHCHERFEYHIPRTLSTIQSGTILFQLEHHITLLYETLQPQLWALDIIGTSPPRVWNRIHQSILITGQLASTTVVTFRLIPKKDLDGLIPNQLASQDTWEYPYFNVAMGLVQNGDGEELQPWVNIPNYRKPGYENVTAISVSLVDAMRKLSDTDSRLQKDDKIGPSGCDTFQSSAGPMTLTPMSMRAVNQPSLTSQKRKFVVAEIAARSVQVKAKTKSYFDPDGMIEHDVTISITPPASSPESLRHLGYFPLGA
ncbi:hypothetical protein CSAL01_06966 [Colletotrichum salicis]|uniref:Uncharacterized protein n=1 Tax=Colletotrichum salicis TaxID=1209931 RepID=A0A135VAA2_9PEZI|nr:hypothetical protein CSAL01_06966 [Colletotrichum salicis]